jgi:hypothetical protein
VRQSLEGVLLEHAAMHVDGACPACPAAVALRHLPEPDPQLSITDVGTLRMLVGTTFGPDGVTLPSGIHLDPNEAQALCAFYAEDDTTGPAT